MGRLGGTVFSLLALVLRIQQSSITRSMAYGTLCNPVSMYLVGRFCMRPAARFSADPVRACSRHCAGDAGYARQLPRRRDRSPSIVPLLQFTFAMFLSCWTMLFEWACLLVSFSGVCLLATPRIEPHSSYSASVIHVGSLMSDTCAFTSFPSIAAAL